MSSKSRWANASDDDELRAAEAARKAEKEAKKRAKAARQAKLEEEAQRATEAAKAEASRPAKRRRLSNGEEDAEDIGVEESKKGKLLRFPAPEWSPCRHIDNFEQLNRIEEGSYGYVTRAKNKNTGEVVALKKLKMENSVEGFPVTGLREIQTLLEAKHPNIVALKEIVMGDRSDQYTVVLTGAYGAGCHGCVVFRVYLVMDFLEHDLKNLLDDMREPFLPSETKTLMLQLTSAVEFLHEHWIMHRDLKTSNLLMNNRGELKIADFGMARYFGDPPPKLTQLVVTLWYRAPELLLGTKTYGTEIDMWSVGCIFGELLLKKPLVDGKNEVDQLAKIFALTGPPTPQTWPTFRSLPNAKLLKLPPTPTASKSSTQPLLPRSKFSYLTTQGLTLLSSLLNLNPATRPTAAQVLSHPYFREDPKPKSKAMFPTFPSKGGLERKGKRDTPNAPGMGEEVKGWGEVDFGGLVYEGEQERGEGFTLRLG